MVITSSRYRLLALSFLLPAVATASLNIPSTPLNEVRSADPNIMYLLDDSGSMMWEIMPEDYKETNAAGYLLPPPVTNVYGGNNYANAGNYYIPYFDDDNAFNVFLRSSDNNTLYYNPNNEYIAWSNGDGTYYDGSSKASATAAYWNTARKTLGTSTTSDDTINLTQQQTTSQIWYRKSGNYSAGSYRYCNNSGCSSTTTSATSTSQSYWPITYFVYKGTGDKTVLQNYVRYQIRGSTGYKRDLNSGSEQTITTFPSGRTVAAEAANFATWFQYYRSRILAAKGSTSLAFADLGSNFRVGFATINERDTGYYVAVPSSGTFTGTNRSNFFQELLSLPISAQGTPLREALQWSGNNFRSNYWKDSVSCRRSFTILTTDGYWSSGSISNISNEDGTMGRPYADSYSDTLADVAMYYWKTDLSALANNIPPTRKNSQTQQHMTTFSLSMGLRGSLDPKVDLPALEAGTKSWPNPTDDDKYKIDDLWHAAVNSRGSFVAAANPDEFRQGLADALSEISSEVPLTPPAASFNTDGETISVEAGYSPDDYSGKLFGKKKATNTNKFSVNLWAAHDLLQSDSGRQIIIGDPSTNYALAFTSTALQSAGLLTQRFGSTTSSATNLVNYLRGNASNEGALYRKRTKTKLGSLMHSTAVEVGPPDGLRNPGGKLLYNEAGYSTFYTTYKDRTRLIYVGANDGMVHAFNATTGREVFAFIPGYFIQGSGLSSLKDMSDTSYVHKFYVDGALSNGAAKLQSGQWRTLLAGGLRAGGKGMFLLDITDPALLTEGNANSIVHWEFSNREDADVGLTFGKPKIAKMNDGTWKVLMPNGYDSANNNGALFFLPVEKVRPTEWSTSGRYKKMVLTAAKGLSDIATYDVDNNGTVDLIYAGDLLGNLWKFDVSASNPAAWTSTKMFTAVGPDGKVQPITFAPVISPNPLITDKTATVAKPNILVSVLGSKYIETCDLSNPMNCSGESTQRSVYSMWDVGVRICGRQDLAQHQVIDFTSERRSTFRYATLNYPDKSVVDAACPVSGVRNLSNATGTQSYNLSTYKLGFYFDFKLDMQRPTKFLYTNDRVNPRLFIGYDYASDVNNSCDKGVLSDFYDNYALSAKPVTGYASPTYTAEELASIRSTLVGKGYSGATLEALMSGLGGRGADDRLPLFVASDYYWDYKISKCKQNVGGIEVIVPNSYCGMGRVIKRVTWREITAY